MHIYVAGHRGMVGRALTARLRSSGHHVIVRSRAELDLGNESAVNDFFSSVRIDQVYVAAGKVGGIHANRTYPASFLYENLVIATHVIHAAHKAGVRKLLYLGSSCIYPRLADQPIREEALLTGPLEPTNEPYAIAKIAGIKLCASYNRQYGETHGTDYRCAMPTNLFGPGDNYHRENSHVLPALIQRFHEAKVNRDPVVSVWGTGNARREFMYVDDLADACIWLMNIEKSNFDRHTGASIDHVNVGTGEEVTIAALASIVRRVVGYTGEIGFDDRMPDGAPRKLLDVSRLRRMGWRHKMPLLEGIIYTYSDFLHAAPRGLETHK